MSMVTSRDALRRSDRRDYHLAFAALFPFFLATALLSRLLPAFARPMPIAQGRYFAVVSDAWRTASRVLPQAFMR